MSGNGKPPLQFPAQPGVPIVGQPFTLIGIGVPCNAQLKCNCGGADVAISIVNSVGVACPSCRKVYNVLFNPTQGKVEFQIIVPQPLQVTQ